MAGLTSRVRRIELVLVRLATAVPDHLPPAAHDLIAEMREWDVSEGHVEQPLPVATDGPHIHDLVALDVRAFVYLGDEQVALDLAGRKQIGIERYGQPLQAHNGRDALRDAYEEALDLLVYLRQFQEETGVELPAYRDAVAVVCQLAALLKRRGNIPRGEG